MPSPDVATYTGLTLVDLSAQELIDAALANLSTRFPGWVPREGNTEVVLLEQFAAVAEDIGYQVNTLPDVVTEVLLRLFGATRDQGAPPQVDVRFTVSDTSGHVIAAGTTVRLNLGAGEPVDFVTDVDLPIGPGEIRTGVVSASGIAPTLEANGQPAGTELEVLDAVGYVESAVVAAPVAGGREAEDGDAFLDRATAILARLTTTLVRPDDVAAYVAEQPGMTRVKVLDLYNPDDVDSAPGRSPGFVTVAVAGDGGASIGTSARATLAAQIRNRMHAGLVVNVVDPTVTVVNVDVVAYRFLNADPVDVEASVRARLAAYLNPDAWEWGSTVYLNDVIADVDRAEGVDRVAAVFIDGAEDDLPLDGYAPLVRLGAVTVEVLTA